MPLCGGTGEQRSADADVQSIADQVKESVTGKTGKSYATFEAVSYKTQVVAGTNFFIKVKTGDAEYIHIRVYQTLPHAGSTLELNGVQEGKSEAEEIQHFQE